MRERLAKEWESEVLLSANRALEAERDRLIGELANTRRELANADSWRDKHLRLKSDLYQLATRGD